MSRKPIYEPDWYCCKCVRFNRPASRCANCGCEPVAIRLRVPTDVAPEKIPATRVKEYPRCPLRQLNLIGMTVEQLFNHAVDAVRFQQATAAADLCLPHVEAICRLLDCLTWTQTRELIDDSAHRSHPVNVMLIALLTARSMGMPLLDRYRLALAALLHDIGAVVFHGSWDEAWSQHPKEGVLFLRQNLVKFPFLDSDVQYAVRYHHEDLSKETAPVMTFAKIVSVASVLDLSLSDRQTVGFESMAMALDGITRKRFLNEATVAHLMTALQLSA